MKLKAKQATATRIATRNPTEYQKKKKNKRKDEI